MPSRSSVVVGSRNTGPAPQVIPFAVGSFGEKNRLWVVAPRPVWVPLPGKILRWLITGSMVRLIRFQLSLIEMGMTGWIFSVKRSPPSTGPTS
ncbi:hypothetical protein [Microbulbifer taiwanensis]|uniref:hypothetical protein n=1 Tax=Microbulbifer taiwanensis TaxID=986746 RepID=UPI0036102355